MHCLRLVSGIVKRIHLVVGTSQTNVCGTDGDMADLGSANTIRVARLMMLRRVVVAMGTGH